MASPRLGGVCAAALTPLDSDLGPDTRALAEHLAWLLANGCDAINLLGTTGEATSFSAEQRLAVLEAVAAAELPLDRIMAGTGAAALADAVRLTRRAVELGYAGALVIPPFYFKCVPEDGVFRYYATLIERVNDARLRLYLYHFPAMSGIELTPALIARLRDAYGETIVGVKDSSGTPGYASGVVAAFEGLDVFPSSEAVLADARRDGYAGCISASVNVTAPLAGLVWHAADGDATRAQNQANLTALRAAIARYPFVPALRRIVGDALREKAWLRIVPPLHPLADDDAATLDAALHENPAFSLIRDAFEARRSQLGASA